jgi:predicted Zn-dependent protease
MADTDLPDTVVDRLQDAMARVEQAEQILEEAERYQDALLQTVAEMAGVPPQHAKLDFENGRVVDTRENT